MAKEDESLPENWEHFEDAQQSAQRRRQELIARLRARLINGQNKLSEEQVAAVVERMADLALRSGLKNGG
jgi:hypothetical protein